SREPSTIRIGELIDLEPPWVRADGLTASAEILEPRHYWIWRDRRRRLRRVDLVVAALGSYQDRFVWATRGGRELQQVLLCRGHIENAHEPHHAAKGVVPNSSWGIGYGDEKRGDAGPAPVAQRIDLADRNRSDSCDQRS